MLYVFHGSLIEKSHEKAHTLWNSLRAKKPDAAFIRVESNDWDVEMIKSHLESQGLFSNKYIVFLDRVTEKTEARDGLVEIIPDMKESLNIFIVLEGKVNAELKKTFDKSADKVVVSEPVEAKTSKFGSSSGEFNIFALADAVGARDPFKAWSIYREAVDKGTEAENIIGTLFWQVKSIVLASNAKSAGDSGLSPFVYSKAKKYVGNYSKEEISGLLEKLITIYHDSHRGVLDAELSVERVLLRLGMKKAT